MLNWLFPSIFGDYYEHPLEQNNDIPNKNNQEELFKNNNINNNQVNQNIQKLYYPLTIQKPTCGFKEEQLITSDKRLLEKYNCLICKKFPFDPVECITSQNSNKYCSAILCKPCYENRMKFSKYKSCPLGCSNDIMKVRNARFIKEAIDLYVKIKCPECNETPIYSEYINHLEKCKNRKYKCNLCSFIGNLYEINKHVEKCPEKKVPCEFCDEMVKYKNLEFHKNKICKEERTTCMKCGQTISKKNYSKHLKKVECVENQINSLKNEFGNKIVKIASDIKKIQELSQDIIKNKIKNESTAKKKIKKTNKVINEELKDKDNNDSYYQKVERFLIFILIPVIILYFFDKFVKKRQQEKF